MHSLALTQDTEDLYVIVQQMLERGAPGTDEEVATVLEYLVRRYGKEN